MINRHQGLNPLESENKTNESIESVYSGQKGRHLSSRKRLQVRFFSRWSGSSGRIVTFCLKTFRKLLIM